MEEIWKDIPGYEGLYQASNLGKIRSIYRYKKILKQYKNYGYLHVQLFKNKKQKYSRVHRLVAQTFIPNCENKPYVNHKDGNKQNNCVDNLEWCTAKENTHHALENGLLVIEKGIKNPMYGRYGINNNHSRKVNQYSLDNILIKKWDSIMDIERFMKKKNINSSIVTCCKGKQKTAFGYIWKYNEEV